MTGLMRAHALNGGAATDELPTDELFNGGAGRTLASRNKRRFGLSASTCALLLGGSILATSVADVAHAQEAGDEGDEASKPVTDEFGDNVIIVSGIRQSLANAQDIKNRLGERITLAELPNAGHAMLPEQPEEIARIVATYLEA